MSHHRLFRLYLTDGGLTIILASPTRPLIIILVASAPPTKAPSSFLCVITHRSCEIPCHCSYHHLHPHGDIIEHPLEHPHLIFLSFALNARSIYALLRREEKNIGQKR